MIPNYKNQISLKLLLRQAFVRQGREKCEEWFRQRTGKKHILLTYSCRSALFLAYAASQRSGKVLTSPLTCTSAIDPIILADKKIKFCDIEPDTLLMNPDFVDSVTDAECSFIQVIHHGGLMADMEKLDHISKKHNLILVEDCGQAFDSSRNGIRSGTSGDIICFSMIKSGYGIGGGVLATDDTNLFEKAGAIQSTWRRPGWILLKFRVIRALLENKRHYSIINAIYSRLMSSRPYRGSMYHPAVSAGRSLRRPSDLFFRLFILQTQRFHKLHEKRRECAAKLCSELSSEGLVIVDGKQYGISCAFDKLFCLLSKPDIQHVTKQLNFFGIEARHLENKHGSFRQPGIYELNQFAGMEGLNLCHNYFNLHDKVLNLPLHEDMSELDYNKISSVLNGILNEENPD